MSMEIILAAVIVGGTGLLLGLFLGLAGKKFAVEIDEKEQQVREQLPGNNCGGCGYAGCDALVRKKDSSEPNMAANGAYAKYFTLYKELYRTLFQSFKDLKNI